MYVIYIYIYIYIYTHTHTHIYIYIIQRGDTSQTAGAYRYWSSGRPTNVSLRSSRR